MCFPFWVLKVFKASVAVTFANTLTVNSGDAMGASQIVAYLETHRHIGI